ncbi:MAG: response regulator transcription factor [Clostridiales Family XIII bacterium]|nr:response regulator transcription factor [Clostridiales Family XIII bacterium]
MIYLVEDDDNIRELVVYTLKNTGFDAVGFPNGGEFRQALERRLPDLVLLDIMLPGDDGLSLLKRLRSAASTAMLPIIMLTARSTEYDRVLGLDMGADDYIPKPFGMMELVARVRRLLLRARPTAASEEYPLGDLHISQASHAVTVGGLDVRLTLKEYDLLLYLARNAGLALTRDQILNSVWGYDFDGETRTVDVHIRTLRGKLGACARMIQTVRGIGYKLAKC